MLDNLKALGILVAVVGLFAFGAWLEVSRYRECRAHDFSVFYCLGK